MSCPSSYLYLYPPSPLSTTLFSLKWTTCMAGRISISIRNLGHINLKGRRGGLQLHTSCDVSGPRIQIGKSSAASRPLSLLLLCIYGFPCPIFLPGLFALSAADDLKARRVELIEAVSSLSLFSARLPPSRHLPPPTPYRETTGQGKPVGDLQEILVCLLKSPLPLYNEMPCGEPRTSTPSGLCFVCF